MMCAVPLAPRTTLGVGGPARFFCEAHTVQEVAEADVYARAHDLPLSVLGAGSNILVPDAGVNGCVLAVAMGAHTLRQSGSHVILSAEAGARWDVVVDAAVAQGAWGIENLTDIPGTVGGAVVQNIGAYGAVLADTFIQADAYDLQDGVMRTFTRDACAFGYRTSVFKRERGRFIVVRASFALARDAQPNLSYRDLAEQFAGRAAPSLMQVRDAIRTIRANKLPDRTHFGTAGSFFLNPVLGEAPARALTARFPGMPLFPLPEGGVKVPVAWLLDYRHGVMDVRGLRHGGASLWPQQPLVIVTEPGATARDVDTLATEVANRVHTATGIAIEREVEWFGVYK